MSIATEISGGLTCATARPTKPTGSSPAAVTTVKPIGLSPSTFQKRATSSFALSGLSTIAVLAPTGSEAVQDLDDGNRQADNQQDQGRYGRERRINLVAHLFMLPVFFMTAMVTCILLGIIITTGCTMQKAVRPVQCK